MEKTVSNIEYWLSAASTFSPGSQRHYLVIPSLLTCSWHGQHVHERAVQHSEGELQSDSGCTKPNTHTVCIGRVLFLAGHSLVLCLSWAVGEVCQQCTHTAKQGQEKRTTSTPWASWTKAQWMGATKASSQKRSLDHQETLTSDTSWLASWGSWRSSLHTHACAQSHVLKPTGLEGLYSPTEMLLPLQIHFRVSVRQVHHNCTLL